MDFIKGMDVSMAKALEACGASYYLGGEKRDLFEILHDCGTTMIRLRLWPDPYDALGRSYGGGTNDLLTTEELARRTVESGMEFLLDFHYSDFWADPAKQVKPKAWEALKGRDLETAVYLHTRTTLKFLKNRGLVPAIVQIGNEITNGLLWPDGHVHHPATMAALLRSGMEAVRAECPATKIALHLDFGTDQALYARWFDTIQPYHLDFDIIAMSYYPHWNGGLDLLLDNMDFVSQQYNRDVMVAETSIGYTTDTLGCSGIVFQKAQEQATGYPATEEGQARFMQDLISTVKSVKHGRGIGVFYWEPAWLPIPDCTWSNPNGLSYMRDPVEAGNTMANQALFDQHGNANMALLNLKTM